MMTRLVTIRKKKRRIRGVALIPSVAGDIVLKLLRREGVATADTAAGTISPAAHARITCGIHSINNANVLTRSNFTTSHDTETVSARSASIFGRGLASPSTGGRRVKRHTGPIVSRVKP